MRDRLEKRMQQLIEAREKAAISFHTIEGAVAECQHALNMLKEIGDERDLQRRHQGLDAGGDEEDLRP
jgi:predicted nucleic acid-binding OB-fold protein